MTHPDAANSSRPETWRASRALIGGCYAALVIAYVLVLAEPGQPLTVVDLAISLAVFVLLGWLMYWILVRSRLVLTANELVIVRWFRTFRIPLTDVVGAEADYYGTTFRLSDGTSRECGCLQAPNYSRWLGRQSRADRVAEYVVRRAALARGDLPAQADVGRPQRGAGNLLPGILQAIVAAILR